MEISESIYEGLVEPYYKKPTRVDANCAGISSHNRGEPASSWTLPKKGESAGKRRKMHVDIPSGKSKTCLIHGPGHSSEECKVLGDFGTKYNNSRHNKYRGRNPEPGEKLQAAGKQHHC